MFWVKYRPAYVIAKKLYVGVVIDGKKVGNWRIRAPYRPMGWTLAKKGKGRAKTFVDKIVASGKDVFRLSPGAHQLKLVSAPGLTEDRHLFEKLTISNDHSLRPEGYDPRADFTKEPLRY